MDSPQSVVSPFQSSSMFPDSDKQNANLEDFIGALEVYIHQARDIHNICIYQNQDVYAKLCLTSDPENTVSTKIINGGGRNPVFKENLSLDVCKVDSSLKCEIWMLSRVRNYLEDQLLGFALVPISEVLLHNKKLEKEFSLSSTDLFHSPAGFVQLSLSYIGAQPDVIPIPPPPASVETDSSPQERDSTMTLPDDLDKIEFPDPKVVNENNQMVEEYFGMPCADEDSQNSDTENQVSSEIESLSAGACNSRATAKIDPPPSSVSTNGTSSASVPISFQSSETPKDPKSPTEEHVSPPKDNFTEKNSNGLDDESNASGGLSRDALVMPIAAVPEPSVVQQEIVDMYMKSMQQFTESLAKMKLPMDFENGPTSSENSTSSEQKTPASKNNGSRVFYGSRAFF